MNSEGRAGLEIEVMVSRNSEAVETRHYTAKSGPLVNIHTQGDVGR